MNARPAADLLPPHLPESSGHLPLATMALIFLATGLLLARDASAFMTGSVLVVDGGYMVSSL